ncbi:MAG TPA: class I SAM-dependent methyltransferase [Alphaproteobacteria bacterium]|nr:class I SAM-dependent methyltransferase [Alphaproteobacteria bacterium]
MPESWLRFWDRPHRIYVNDRHLRVHYARIADDILSVLPDRGGVSVLDFGCGEALDASRVAARVGRLYLYDGAPSVRARLARRFANNPKVAVLDQAGLDAIAENSLDVIVAFSVIQYIDRLELPGLLAGWRSKLAVGGFVVLADVIPPTARLLDDIGSLLSTARAHGFLLAALGGLVTTLFSDYRRLRRDVGLATYDDREILALLRDAGLAAVIPQGRNLGFNQARRTYIARRL